jgi:hypothetical protein
MTLFRHFLPPKFPLVSEILSFSNALPPQKEEHVTSYLIEYYNALRLGVAILVILSSIQSHSKGDPSCREPRTQV